MLTKKNTHTHINNTQYELLRTVLKNCLVAHCWYRIGKAYLLASFTFKLLIFSS